MWKNIISDYQIGLAPLSGKVLQGLFNIEMIFSEYQLMFYYRISHIIIDLINLKSSVNFLQKNSPKKSIFSMKTKATNLKFKT